MTAAVASGLPTARAYPREPPARQRSGRVVHAQEGDQLGVGGLDPLDRLAVAGAQVDDRLRIGNVHRPPGRAVVHPALEDRHRRLVSHGSVVPSALDAEARALRLALVPRRVVRHGDQAEAARLEALAAEAAVEGERVGALGAGVGEASLQAHEALALLVAAVALARLRAAARLAATPSHAALDAEDESGLLAGRVEDRRAL